MELIETGVSPEIRADQTASDSETPRDLSLRSPSTNERQHTRCIRITQFCHTMTLSVKQCPVKTIMTDVFLLRDPSQILRPIVAPIPVHMTADKSALMRPMECEGNKPMHEQMAIFFPDEHVHH